MRARLAVDSRVVKNVLTPNPNRSRGTLQPHKDTRVSQTRNSQEKRERVPTYCVHENFPSLFLVQVSCARCSPFHMTAHPLPLLLDWRGCGAGGRGCGCGFGLRTGCAGAAIGRCCC